MTTLLSPRTTQAYLAYLGYDDHYPDDQALNVTPTRRRRKRKTQRNVFLGYVFGATGSGKTELLKSFVGKSFEEGYVPTERPFGVVNS